MQINRLVPIRSISKFENSLFSYIFLTGIFHLIFHEKLLNLRYTFLKAIQTEECLYSLSYFLMQSRKNCLKK